MKLCVSNLAWHSEEDSAIGDLLQQHGISGVEIAPTKVWADPTQASDAGLAAYRLSWKNRSIVIPALQSLLFGRPDLTIFEDERTRERTLAYLSQIAVLARKLGAEVLIFGSPKNRSIGVLDPERALAIGIDFFRQAGDAAHRAGVHLAIEPNPAAYGCDFIRTVKEGIDFVRTVGHPCFRLNVDASAMIVNGEDFESALMEASEWMVHFHISEPHLALLGSHEDAHRRIATALRRIGWTRWISIEMRSGQTETNQLAVARALQFVRKIYLQ
jgi:D-psicose/D-tagatose/L-ribulose 3-epimerase